MGREPFNYKKTGRMMDEPSSIWEQMQTRDERWKRRPERRLKFDWSTVIVLLVMAAAVILIAALVK